MVKMDRCLRSRRAFAAWDGKAALVTSNIASQESISDNELVRNITRQTHTHTTDTPHTPRHTTHTYTPAIHTYTPATHITHTHTPHTYTTHTRHTHQTHTHTPTHHSQDCIWIQASQILCDNASCRHTSSSTHRSTSQQDNCAVGQTVALL
jgi:hypothetical protein